MASIIGGGAHWKKKEKKLTTTKYLIKPEDIVLEKIKVVPKIPKYNLPLKTKEIANYQIFSEKIQLSPRALSLLKKNGFVVIPTPKDIAASKVFIDSLRRDASPKDEFVGFYEVIKNKELPLFITTDSLLHHYYILFNTTLLRLERELFYDDLWQMSKEFLEDAILEYNNAAGDLKEAAKRNVAYFSVALELLKPKSEQVLSKKNIKKEIVYLDYYPKGKFWEEFISTMIREGKLFNLFNKQELAKYSFKIPAFVKDLVRKEIELIKKAEGWKFSPIFVYKEDYSQYVPRGYYTTSEKLKNYFKAMIWYGRMTNLIRGSKQLQKGQSKCLDDGIISIYDAKIQTLQASLIVKKFLKSQNIRQKWQRIYAITAFFVGFSDDLGPYEYSAALNALFKKKITSQDLEKKYPEIRNTLLNLPFSPKIYSGLGRCELTAPFSPKQAKRFLENTKGFRLMGQRLAVDTYLFSKIVSPYSGEYTGNRTPRPFTCVVTPAGREVRGFPRGLDIMALLGSERAKEILKELGDTEYSDYEKKFSELKAEIDALSLNDWFKNLYWNWLYVLRTLLTKFGEGYQTFMQTKAWQDKNLTTALASWTELKHATILYVKQIYTMAERNGIAKLKIVGYVEPTVEFYARLLTLTKMTNKGLKELIPKEELEKLKIEPALNKFAEILEKLLEISKKELENKALTEEEYDFIKYFGSVLEGVIELVIKGEQYEAVIDPDIFKTSLIVDVHTDGNTKQVLEEGVGHIKTLVVAYKLPEGHILVGVGPVFSYYEFKQPMQNRLTDRAWREMLNTQPPVEPEWIKSFSE